MGSGGSKEAEKHAVFTPYGNGYSVGEAREEDDIIIVLLGYGVGFLQADTVKRMTVAEEALWKAKEVAIMVPPVADKVIDVSTEAATVVAGVVEEQTDKHGPTAMKVSKKTGEGAQRFAKHAGMFAMDSAINVAAFTLDATRAVSNATVVALRYTGNFVLDGAKNGLNKGCDAAHFVTDKGVTSGKALNDFTNEHYKGFTKAGFEIGAAGSELAADAASASAAGAISAAKDAGAEAVEAAKISANIAMEASKGVSAGAMGAAGTVGNATVGSLAAVGNASLNAASGAVSGVAGAVTGAESEQPTIPVETASGLGTVLGSVQADGKVRVKLASGGVETFAASAVKPILFVQLRNQYGLFNSSRVYVSASNVELVSESLETNDKATVERVFDYSSRNLKVQTAYGEGMLIGSPRLDGILSVKLPYGISFVHYATVTLK